MNFLQILLLLRTVDIQRILSLPDLDNSGDVRQWCEALVDAGLQGASLTPFSHDDAILEALDAIIESDEAWEALYGLLYVFLGDKEDEESPLIGTSEIKSTRQSTAIYAATGISPSVVILIVQAVAELIQWLRSRR